VEGQACRTRRLFPRAGPAGRLMLLAALAAAAWAQSASFEAPVLGYAFDAAAGSIRPILGVPGAARFEAPFRSEGALRQAALAPWRDYALAEMDGELRIVRWDGGAISSHPLDGAPAEPGRIAFSPSGASVALDAAGRIEVWSGMPERAVLTRRIEHPGPVDALAVTDDGRTAAVASAGTVVLYSPGGAKAIAEGGRISSLAFALAGSDLAIADEERNEVLLAGAGVLSRDFEKPSSVSFSADGGKLIVASAARSAVALIDLASREVSTASCDCRVETLNRARGNAVFRLSDSAKGHAPLFDGDGAEPRIVFVAAGEEWK